MARQTITEDDLRELGIDPAELLLTEEELASLDLENSRPRQDGKRGRGAKLRDQRYDFERQQKLAFVVA